MALPENFDIGWIGLGAMGWPMANQLLRNSSVNLVIFDVNQAVLDQFAREAPSGRVEIAGNAKQVTDKSKYIFTIVPEGRHVKEVYLTPTGLLAGNTSGKVFIDCSTIDLATCKVVREAVESSGDQENSARFHDCPVSGGTAGAAKGIITFMVGMNEKDPDFPFLRNLLSMMGKSILPMGGAGLGLAAKLSNNYLSGTIALATSEAMNLGMKLGIDPKVLSDCFDKGSAANWVNATVNPVPGVCPTAVTSNKYQGGFKVQLMEKDLKLAAEAANNVGARLVLADTTIAAYHSAASHPRYRDRDSRVVYQWLEGADPEETKE